MIQEVDSSLGEAGGPLRHGCARPEGWERFWGPRLGWKPGTGQWVWQGGTGCIPSGGSSHLCSTQRTAWAFQKYKSGCGLLPALKSFSVFIGLRELKLPVRWALLSLRETSGPLGPLHLPRGNHTLSTTGPLHVPF